MFETMTWGYYWCKKTSCVCPMDRIVFSFIHYVLGQVLFGVRLILSDTVFKVPVLFICGLVSSASVAINLSFAFGFMVLFVTLITWWISILGSHIINSFYFLLLRGKVASLLCYFNNVLFIRRLPTKYLLNYSVYTVDRLFIVETFKQ